MNPESMESHWCHVHDRVGGEPAGAALGQEPPKQTVQAIGRELSHKCRRQQGVVV